MRETLTVEGLDGWEHIIRGRCSDPEEGKPSYHGLLSLSAEHSGLTTGVAFGHHAKFIASTGMDRSLKFYSL